MSQRTTVGRVAAVLVDSSLSSNGQGDYDGTTDLQPYIDAASNLIDSVAALDVADNAELSSTTLELMERWMAADYYTVMDPIYKSKSTAGASASFNDRKYRDTAVDLDTTGYLNALLKRQRAGGAWLGVAQDQYADDEASSE